MSEGTDDISHGETNDSRISREEDDNAREEELFSKIAQSGGLVIVGFFVQKIFAFGTRLLMGRALGTEGYGAVALGIVLLTFTVMISVLGIDTGVARYLPRYTDKVDRNGIVRAGFQLTLVTSLMIAIFLWVGAEFLAHNIFGNSVLVEVIRVFAVVTPFATLMRFSVGVIQGNERTIPKVLVQNLTLPSVRFIGVLGAVVLGYGIGGVLWAFVVAYVAAALLGFWYALRNISFLGGTSGLTRRELLNFSLPLVIGSVSATIFADIDTFLIAFFQPVGDVGIYDATYVLANSLTVVMISFRFMTLPILSDMHQSGEFGELRNIYRIVTKWSFLLILPVIIVFIAYGEEILVLTFGTVYTEGSLTLGVLAIGFGIHVAVGPAGAAIVAFGYPKLHMADYIVAAAFNIGFNLVLIPRFSYLGAAVATVLSFILLNALFLIQIYRVVGIQPTITDISLPFCLGVIAGGGVYFLTELLIIGPFITVFVASLLFFPLYAGIVYHFALGQTEWALLKRIDILRW